MRSVQEKVAVKNVVVYEDDDRKVECVHFNKDHYGLRLANKKENTETKLGLSRIAVEQIALGLNALLSPKRGKIRMQKFIMDDAPQPHWTQVKDTGTEAATT